MKAKARHSSRGFSLIEVLCAILILGIALTALTGGLSTALQSTKEAEIQTHAALFAAGLIETLRAEGFYTAGTTEGKCGPELPAHRWRQTITASTPEGLFHVTVVIEQDRNARQVFELQTLLFEPPLTAGTEPSTRERRRGGQQEGRR